MKRRLFLKLFALTGLVAFAPPLYARAAKRASPKTVSELYVAMCEALPVGQSTVIRWSVTGEKYVEYAIGIRADETSVRGIDPEEELCRWQWRTFLAQLAKLDDPDNSWLYWRIKPEFAFIENDDERFDVLPSKARIYSRYLISSKPPRFSEDELLAGAHRSV